MKLNWHILIALLILAGSLALLLWGLWPMPKESHILPVSPSNLTLPTPSSYAPDPFAGVDPI